MQITPRWSLLLALGLATPVLAATAEIRQARFHVVHNGHVIHDNVALTGGTQWRGPHAVSEYEAHGDQGPIQMQDHGNPVRFRNIWVVPLAD